MDAATVERLADLAVGFGANVQSGQMVYVQAEIGQEPLARAVATSAYRRGARFVDVDYFDPHVKRARILYAADDTLEFVPSWYGARMLAVGEQRCARIKFTGPTASRLFEGLDASRLGRDQLPTLKESIQLMNERSTNWSIVPCPTPGWAELVHPDLEPAAALARLWREIVHVCRLDEPDPIAAWQARIAALVDVAGRLTERQFDALQLEGPGTDLRVGLLPTSSWRGARFETRDGLQHMPNLPTEEVFTSPDPERVEGIVTATRPLELQGAIVRGLRVRFEGGRAVEIDAEGGAETLRKRCALDEGAARLGEVALVDREGRIGPLETVFYDTLLDENAASHIALGTGFEFALGEDDLPRLNRSAIHIDFMIGSDELEVTGIGRAGERVPVLRRGVWQI